MSQKYAEQIIVPFYFINSTREMNLSALFNAMLLVSEHQLHALGLDSQQLVAQHGLGWVVTKYHLDVQAMPRLDERITITTEANSYNKFFCYRTFTVQDAHGQELLRLISNWVMLDIQTRKMVLLDPQIMQQLDCPYSPKVWNFPRIDLVEYPALPREYRTRFFDIDVNGHVNNSIYSDWMLDSLDRDFLLSHDLQAFDIKFEREVHYGETVQSFVQLEQNVSHHLIKSAAGTNAQAQITWKTLPQT